MYRPLIAIALILASLAGSTSQAQASKFELSVMQDDNLLIYSSAQNRVYALNKMKALGLDAVRVSVLWDAVAPKHKLRNGADPKAYRAANWDKYDDLAREAAARGIGVYFDVTPPGPRWTQAKANDPANQRTGNPDMRQFGRFVQAVGKRYSGTYKDENEDKGTLPRVTWWGVGNQTNQVSALSVFLYS